MESNDVINNVVIGVVSTALVGVLGWAMKLIFTGDKTFSGKWDQYSYGPNRNLERHDESEMWQIGSYVTGKAQRKVPEDQNHKKWKLMGCCFGQTLYLIYWGVDGATIGESHGCAALHQDPSNPNRYVGQYLKLIKGETVEIKNFPMSLTRGK